MDVADQLLETGELVTLGLTDHYQPQPMSMITSKMLMLDWHGIVLIANTESSSSCFGTLAAMVQIGQGVSITCHSSNPSFEA
jgi:hypothetical protein